MKISKDVSIMQLSVSDSWDKNILTTIERYGTG